MPRLQSAAQEGKKTFLRTPTKKKKLWATGLAGLATCGVVGAAFALPQDSTSTMSTKVAPGGASIAKSSSSSLLPTPAYGKLAKPSSGPSVHLLEKYPTPPLAASWAHMLTLDTLFDLPKNTLPKILPASQKGTTSQATTFHPVQVTPGASLVHKLKPLAPGSTPKVASLPAPQVASSPVLPPPPAPQVTTTVQVPTTTTVTTPVVTTPPVPGAQDFTPTGTTGGVYLPTVYNNVKNLPTQGDATTILLSQGRVSWPVHQMVSMIQDYGPRIHPIRHTPDFHTGQDMAVPCGTEVYAATSGVVSYAGSAGGYGNRVVLQAGNGIITTYSHLSSLQVTVGQKVGLGAPLALSGATGNATGCHLHFEVIQNGYFTNPWSWLTGVTPVLTTKVYANNGYYYYHAGSAPTASTGTTPPLPASTSSVEEQGPVTSKQKK